MSWTKRDIVRQAYEDIGVASYAFDISPEMETAAVRRLDAMMAQWDAKGIRLGYPVSNTSDGSSVEQDSNLPSWAIEAVCSNLAMRVGGTIGKQITPVLSKVAHEGWLQVVTQCARPRERRLDVMPAGAGNKTTQSQYFIMPEADDSLQSSGDGTLEL